MALKQISLEELSKHNTETDAWIAVHKHVYDVTKFAKLHPGGKGVLLRFAGKDCTQEFDQHHGELVMYKYHEKLVIGALEEKPKKKKEYPVVPLPDVFGELFPFGDPNWYQGWVSPYYNDSHRRLRAYIREFTDKEVIPNVHRWDEAKSVPKEFLMRSAKDGLLALICGPPFPTKYVETSLPQGIKPEEVDHFHELVLIDELSRCASGGFMWGINGGLSIGLPPILKFGSEDLRERIARECLAGRKTICLAVTEPWGGSDVANLMCEAKKTPCGKFYIVNGEKKWITNGVTSDYFTTAVRTGGPGMKGVSLLVIERSAGVATKPIACMGVWASGTTYVTFENVKVPVENLIGKENQGFKYIMNNFNHERWSIVCQANRFARVCLEESLKFAMRRRAFGKLLIDQPVIRAKIAEMGRQVMATHAALEDLTYQFCKMPRPLQPLALGGHTALLKVQSTRTLEFCAREACQILGGNSYTRGGQGEKVERLYREVRAYAIPGGSEEIMMDLGVRQSLKISKFVRAIREQNRLIELQESAPKAAL